MKKPHPYTVVLHVSNYLVRTKSIHTLVGKQQFIEMKQRKGKTLLTDMKQDQADFQPEAHLACAHGAYHSACTQEDGLLFLLSFQKGRSKEELLLRKHKQELLEIV